MKKTFLAAAVALGALAISVPAHADPRGNDYSYNQRDEYRGSDRDYRGPDRSDYRNDQRGGYRHTFSREELDRLERRIDRGYRSGQLTRHEANRLSVQLTDLRQRTRYYWRTDGRMTHRERRDIEIRYDRLSYAIRAQIRDDDTRYGDNRGPRRY